MTVYAYVGGNPVSSIDPLGLWNTDTHNRLFEMSLGPCGVDPNTIAAIQAESASWDKATGLGTAGANYHAMAMPGQSAADAIAGTNEFIADQLEWASMKLDYNEPDWVVNYARAVHAMQDSTSPAHRNEDGIPYVWPSFPNALYHGDSPLSQETWDQMTPALLAQNIAMARAAWGQLGLQLNCGCGK